MLLNNNNIFKFKYSNKTDLYSYVSKLRFKICNMININFKLSNLGKKYRIKAISLVNNSIFMCSINFLFN